MTEEITPEGQARSERVRKMLEMHAKTMIVAVESFEMARKILFLAAMRKPTDEDETQ